MEIGDDDELLDMFFTNEEESGIGGDDYLRHVLCAPEIDAEVLEMFFHGRSSTNKEQKKPIKVKKNNEAAMATGKQNEPQQPAATIMIAPATPPAIRVTEPKKPTTTTTQAKTTPMINLEKNVDESTTSRVTSRAGPKKPTATMHATPVTAAVNRTTMTRKVQAAPMKRKASDMEQVKKSRVQQKALKKSARAALDPHYECPRCHGFDTRFYDFNNSSVKSIRYFCRPCKQNWTLGKVPSKKL